MGGTYIFIPFLEVEKYVMHFSKKPLDLIFDTCLVVFSVPGSCKEGFTGFVMAFLWFRI